MRDDDPEEALASVTARVSSPDELAADGYSATVGVDAEDDMVSAMTIAAGATIRPYIEAIPPSPAATTADDAAPSDGQSTLSTFEDYEMLGEIGRGGMGVVYRARQSRLQREVAIKKVASRHPVIRDKFVGESRVTGLLDHPNIVPVYDLLSSEEGEDALSMKLVRGTSWKEVLHPSAAATEPRDLDFHLGVLMAVSNAVAFAHSRGFTHNDLKPENVMVGEFGEVLVLDWGLATAFGDRESVAPHASSLHSPSGTPAYWAPELAKGKGSAIGPWTDVYLLGAILHEIATGRPPHRGATMFSLIRAAVRSEPPVFDGSAPPGLEAICRKALAGPPDARYASVDAFQEALRAFLKHRESRAISSAAKATLERSKSPSGEVGEGTEATRRTRVYVDFAEIAAGFRQALVLWPENAEAVAGERDASRTLAELALGNGDYGLAEVQALRLDPSADETRELLQRIRRAEAERARAKSNARRMRIGLAGAVGVIVLGLTIGIVAVRAAHRAAERSAELATTRLADIRRLADVKRLEEDLAAADRLWPAIPDKVPAMEAWLTGARALAAHLDGHRAYLAQLKEKATDDEIFASHEDQWEYDTLLGLVAGLDSFALKTIPDMERRLASARDLARRSFEEPRALWDSAIASIADKTECPAYAGLRIAPQMGLVPLGRDASSGLWEFAHLPSGEVPKRGGDGKIVLTESMGVVLVLIPGGTFAMGDELPSKDHPLGSPNVDPEARKSEGPVHSIALGPFFLGKYEFTQGQWLRAMGTNPSAYPAGVVVGGRTHTLLHPVEQVSWKESRVVFDRVGLGFATEAEWEYATRAGTTTLYWTGATKESLQGATNLADHYCKENGGPGSWQFESWLEDGYVVHAPVGSFRPNAFGLYDMAGNVWEFVEDHYGSYDLPVRAGDGERIVPGDTPRVFRGGGFRSNAVHARSADRYSLYAPDFRGFDIGIRAARKVD